MWVEDGSLSVELMVCVGGGWFTECGADGVCGGVESLFVCLQTCR